MRYSVSLSTGGPLAISLSRATGNQLETMTHIPGTVWRGAAAAEYRRERGLGDKAHRDEGFATLFLDGKVRFGDLRLEGAAPWPDSARWCKLEHGEHETVDLLLAGAQQSPLPFECRDCRGKLEAPGGLYALREGRPERLSARKRLTAHTAVSNATMTVRSEQFFTAEVVERHQVFRGDLWVESNAEKAVQAWLSGGKRTLTVGRGATRGQGRVTAEFVPDDEAEAQSTSDMEQRIERFNEAWGQKEETAFSCTLLSPCLVYDRWLRSRAYLEPEDIAEAGGAALDDYEARPWFSRTLAISGWHAAAVLPKPDVTAIAAGGSFVFVRKIPPGERAAEYRRLAVLLDKARRGIGERWEEGYGEASFCDPFHVERRYLS